MNCQTYIENSNLHVLFSRPYFTDSIASLGDGLLDFSSSTVEGECAKLLGALRAEFVRGVALDMAINELTETLKNAISNVDCKNVYLNFYLDAYMTLLLCLRFQRSKAAQILNSFLLEGGAGLNTRGVDFSNQAESSKWGEEIFLNDIKLRQENLKADLDRLNIEYQELSPMQGIYLLFNDGRGYSLGGFKTKLSCPGLDEEISSDKLHLYLIKNNPAVVELTQIQSLDELLSFELFNTVKAGLSMRVCKYCNEYFIVRGRIDTEYCERIKQGEKKPCSIIGATRNYWEAKTDDPVYAQFQRAYKRAHSRRRVGSLTPLEFEEWSKQARAMRDKCSKGKISLEEFTAWLGNNK